MSDERKCPWAEEYLDKDGYCKAKRHRCGISGCGDIYVGEKDFDKFAIIDRHQSCSSTSIFGNYVYEITEEHIQALREGKILADRDEYGIFISLKKD